MAQAQIEEMMGNAAEKFIVDVRNKYNKRAPTQEEHKQIGHALNELRKYTKKRVASTSNRIYFKGITI